MCFRQHMCSIIAHLSSGNLSPRVFSFKLSASTKAACTTEWDLLVCVAIETPRVCVRFLLESVVDATSSLPFPLIPARLTGKWTPLTFQRLPPSWLLTHYTPWRAIAVPLTAAQIGWKRCLWRTLWSAELLLSCALAVCLHPGVVLRRPGPWSVEENRAGWVW